MTTALNVDAEVLFEALNDPGKAEVLMTERGWSAEDLVAQAEALNKSLVESMASINCV